MENKSVSVQSKNTVSSFPEGPDSLRARLSSVIDGNVFDSFVVGVIGLNMIFVVYETDATARGDKPSWANSVTGSFLSFFVIEISLRVFVHRRTYFDSWVNILDLGIVAADVFAQLAVNVVKGAPSVSVMRIFRIMRLLRVIRAASGFRELWLMLHGLVSAFKAMVWASVLIMVVLVVWSVIAVEVINPFIKELDLEECVGCDESFRTVTDSIFTWFLLIFTGNKWEELAIPMMQHHPFLTPIFVSAYVTINLGVMNLILTVIVDRASEARAEDEATHLLEKKARQQRARDALEKVCQAMDEDNSGELSKEEVFEGYSSNADFKMTLDLMDVKEEDLKTVWNMMDSDRSGSVSCTEFVDQVHRMKTQESHTMLVFIKHYLNEVRFNVSEELGILQNTMLKELKREEKVLEAELSPGPVMLQPKLLQPQPPMVMLKDGATPEAWPGLDQEWDYSAARRKLPAAPSGSCAVAQPLPETLETFPGLVASIEAGSSGSRQATCSRPSQTDFSASKVAAGAEDEQFVKTTRM